MLIDFKKAKQKLVIAKALDLIKKSGTTKEEANMLIDFVALKSVTAYAKDSIEKNENDAEQLVIYRKFLVDYGDRLCNIIAHHLGIEP